MKGTERAYLYVFLRSPLRTAPDPVIFDSIYRIKEAFLLLSGEEMHYSFCGLHQRIRYEGKREFDDTSFVLGEAGKGKQENKVIMAGI